MKELNLFSAVRSFLFELSLKELKLVSLKNFAVIFFCLSLSANLLAQDEKLYLANARALDTARYVEYDGEPYFLEEWSKAKITSVGGVIFEDVDLNYNGFEGEFELVQKGQFIRLPEKLYNQIELQIDSDPEINKMFEGPLTFKFNAHPKLRDHYSIVLIDTEDIQLYQKFYVTEHTSKTETPGKTVTVQRFYDRNNFYLVKGDDFEEIKLSKKSVTKVLGHKKEVDKLLSDSKIKLKHPKDLKALILLMIENGYVD